MNLFRNAAPSSILLAQKTISCFRKDTYFLERLGDCVYRKFCSDKRRYTSKDNTEEIIHKLQRDYLEFSHVQLHKSHCLIKKIDYGNDR